MRSLLYDVSPAMLAGAFVDVPYRGGSWQHLCAEALREGPWSCPAPCRACQRGWPSQVRARTVPSTLSARTAVSCCASIFIESDGWQDLR